MHEKREKCRGIFVTIKKEKKMVQGRVLGYRSRWTIFLEHFVPLIKITVQPPSHAKSA